MAAANTDLLRKKKSNFSTTISSGISDSDTTIPLSSVSGLPTDTAITLTIDRVDADDVATPTKREKITGIAGVGGLTSALRGEDGSTAQAHTSGAIVEDIWEAGTWNDMVDWGLTEHNQDGSHKKVTGMDNNTAVTQKDASGTARAIVKLNSNNVLELGVSGTTVPNEIYLSDSGAADAYAVTATPAPVAYAAGMKIVFKATNANTGAATLNVNSLGAKSLKRYGTTALSAGDIAAGQLVTVIYDGTNFLMSSAAAGTTLSKASSSEINTGTDDAKYITALGLRGSVLQNMTGLINGKITTSVASNNITVAIKTLAGSDPSSSDPVFVRIGNSVRVLTAALSVTKNAGTNWFNSGGAELATQEVDYFVYMGYNATDGITLGFARFPTANYYSDFSTTSTNEKYCAISTITTAASTDDYTVVGRFNATLSASASYNWSLPGTSIVIQKPIFETRWLTAATTFAGFSSNPTGTIYYRIQGGEISFYYVDSTAGTSNGTGLTFTVPLAVKRTLNNFGQCFCMDNSAHQTTPAHMKSSAGSNTITARKSWFDTNWTSSGTKNIYIQVTSYEFN